jgi:NTP pyrophosphatase (non-canonical NTP hydrolase)
LTVSLAEAYPFRYICATCHFAESARQWTHVGLSSIEGGTVPSLKENPTITDFQNYVVELENERGFANQHVLEKCLLLGEEIGELFKAIRKKTNISIDKNSKVGEVSEEIADILIMLCSVANRLDVNIEHAFRAKEEINKTRKWSSHE